MWEAFLDGFFGALTKTAKVSVFGFFVFWGLYKLLDVTWVSFILGHVIVGAIWAYEFEWFR